MVQYNHDLHKWTQEEYAPDCDVDNPGVKATITNRLSGVLCDLPPGGQTASFLNPGVAGTSNDGQVDLHHQKLLSETTKGPPGPVQPEGMLPPASGTEPPATIICLKMMRWFVIRWRQLLLFYLAKTLQTSQQMMKWVILLIMTLLKLFNLQIRGQQWTTSLLHVLLLTRIKLYPVNDMTYTPFNYAEEDLEYSPLTRLDEPWTFERRTSLHRQLLQEQPEQLGHWRPQEVVLPNSPSSTTCHIQLNEFQLPAWKVAWKYTALQLLPPSRTRRTARNGSTTLRTWLVVTMTDRAEGTLHQPAPVITLPLEVAPASSRPMSPWSQQSPITPAVEQTWIKMMRWFVIRWRQLLLVYLAKTLQTSQQMMRWVILLITILLKLFNLQIRGQQWTTSLLHVLLLTRIKLYPVNDMTYTPFIYAEEDLEYSPLTRLDEPWTFERRTSLHRQLLQEQPEQLGHWRPQEVVLPNSPSSTSCHIQLNEFQLPSWKVAWKYTALKLLPPSRTRRTARNGSTTLRTWLVVTMTDRAEGTLHQTAPVITLPLEVAPASSRPLSPWSQQSPITPAVEQACLKMMRWFVIRWRQLLLFYLAKTIQTSQQSKLTVFLLGILGFLQQSFDNNRGSPCRTHNYNLHHKQCLGDSGCKRMLCETSVTVFLKTILYKKVVLLEEPPATISTTNSVSVLWVIGVAGTPFEESTLHLTTDSQLSRFCQENLYHKWRFKKL
jgi:hypothetical protein